MTIDLNSSIGMFLGLAIGDAMGAPLEFEKTIRLPNQFVTKYQSGGRHNVSHGEWTDDTSMAMAMAFAFLEGGFNPHLIMENFLQWKNNGKFSPRGEMFDVGVTTYKALREYERDKSNPFKGSQDPMSAGNGGLMRLAPAIICASSCSQAIRFAEESTRLTHGAEEALMYSRIFAEEMWKGTALNKFRKFKHPLDIDRFHVKSGGYVKETYEAAWWAFQTTSSFEDCIIKAINLGYDADTTGAVAGMIAGRMYGFEAIPRWMITELQCFADIIFFTKKMFNRKRDFLYEDGSKDTKLSSLMDIRKKIDKITDPIPGKIYLVEGQRCLCIAVNASYGGGLTNCWATEGHSAQMTYRGQILDYDGYIKGKCLKISDVPLGIVFQPNIHEVGWRGRKDEYLEKKFVRIKDIRRYDINWN